MRIVSSARGPRERGPVPGERQTKHRVVEWDRLRARRGCEVPEMNRVIGACCRDGRPTDRDRVHRAELAPDQSSGDALWREMPQPHRPVRASGHELGRIMIEGHRVDRGCRAAGSSTDGPDGDGPDGDGPAGDGLGGVPVHDRKRRRRIGSQSWIAPFPLATASSCPPARRPCSRSDGGHGSSVDWTCARY